MLKGTQISMQVHVLMSSWEALGHVMISYYYRNNNSNHARTHWHTPSGWTGRVKVILLTGRLSGCRPDHPLCSAQTCFTLLSVCEWESCICAVHADVNTVVCDWKKQRVAGERLFMCVTESILYLWRVTHSALSATARPQSQGLVPGDKIACVFPASYWTVIDSGASLCAWM